MSRVQQATIPSSLDEYSLTFSSLMYSSCTLLTIPEWKARFKRGLSVFRLTSLMRLSKPPVTNKILLPTLSVSWHPMPGFS